MKHLTLTAAAMLLAACSVPPESGKSASQPLNKETVKMSENKTPSEMQKEILTNLLEIMASSQSIKDFSLERLEQVFGIKMLATKDRADSYYFFANLSKNWNWHIDKSKDPIEGQDGVEFSFNSTAEYNNTHKAHENPNITEICGMGFDEFVQNAEKLGFTQEPNIVQDGMQVGVYLNRNDLQVEVLHQFGTPESEPDATEKKACIRMILIG